MKSIITLGLLISLASCKVLTKWHRSGDGSLYFIEPEQKYNWFAAWNECIRKNMTLLAIDTHEKHIQIDTLIKSLHPTTCAPIWLAGHDNAIDQRYEWASTGEVFTFSNWSPNQPNRGQNEHCIVIWKEWDWHDAICSNRYGFICEENRLLKDTSNKFQEIAKTIQNNGQSMGKTGQNTN